MNAPAEVIDNTRRLCERCGLLVTIAHYNNSLIDHCCYHDNPCGFGSPPCEKCKTQKAPPGEGALPPGMKRWSGTAPASVPKFGQEPPPRKTKPAEPAQAAKPIQPSLFGEPDSLPPPPPSPKSASASASAKGMPRKAKHAAGSETSHAAAESINGDVLNDMQLRVLETIIDSPGMTCDEVEVKLDPMPHQTVSARIKELRDSGYIEESGEQRNTRRGRKAVVYKATNKARGS